LLLLPVGLVHCGGDDESGSSSDKLCKEVDAKVAECNVTFGSGSCQADSALEKCLAQCVVDSPCASLTDDSAESAFVRCGFACQGATADWFICADGQRAIEPRGICDGNFDCGDGSDEASCAGDGGA